ncbi:hypothetical protein SprV_0100430600 [Sparganum proliferum]
MVLLHSVARCNDLSTTANTTAAAAAAATTTIIIVSNSRSIAFMGMLIIFAVFLTKTNSVITSIMIVTIAVSIISAIREPLTVGKQVSPSHSVQMNFL